MIYLDIVKGTARQYNLLLDVEGAPYILETGEKLIFTVKDDKGETIIRKEVSDTAGDEGEYPIVINSVDTANIQVDEVKVCWYNVLLNSDGEFYTVISTSPFVITSNIGGEYNND